MRDPFGPLRLLQGKQLYDTLKIAVVQGLRPGNPVFFQFHAFRQHFLHLVQVGLHVFGFAAGLQQDRIQRGHLLFALSVQFIDPLDHIRASCAEVVVVLRRNLCQHGDHA